MEFEHINSDEKHAIELLRKLDQHHIISQIASFSSDQRLAFVEQIKKLNSTYPGGLEAYYNRARKLLKDSSEDVNPYEGYAPHQPKGEKIDFYSSNVQDLEDIGVDELKHTAFVLVAGGLGERLGYNGIKIAIPIDLVTSRTFLEYYITYILAFQAKTSPNRELPLAIMTSDDTYELTVKLLEDNNYFGMSRNQLTIMKQEKVPALLDADGHFALKGNSLEIDTKPHGHGDVHTLLYQTSLVKKWHEEGRKWVMFFQDTNPLVFKSIIAVLGLSKQRNFEVNSIVVPRKPGEAVGAICTLVKEGEKTLTINVEYNQLGGLFKAVGGEKLDSQGFSIYPGNINCLVFSIPEYLQTLNETQGCIAEFINPKYADSTKTKFKTPTRLECMMQDYPKLLKTNDRVGVTQIDKKFCFSACKNDIKTAAQKWKDGLPSESSSSCEYDFYKVHEEILKIVGVQVEETKAEPKSLGGIEYKFGPKIVLTPSFGITLKEVKSKFKGTNFVSAESTLVLDGDIYVENLKVDGSLVVKSKESRIIKNLSVVSKNYVGFDELAGSEADVAEYLKIRGYTAVGAESVTLI